MSEYDATSRPATRKYRENYDRVFRAAKELRKARSEQRRCTCTPWEGVHTVNCASQRSKP